MNINNIKPNYRVLNNLCMSQYPQNYSLLKFYINKIQISPLILILLRVRKMEYGHYHQYTIK